MSMTSLTRSPKLLTLIAVATVAAVSAQAEEFSWQLSGATSRAEAGDFDSESWAVDGTYYLNPIDDSAGPYALSSFLNPTTRVSLAASERESNLISDPTAYTLSGAYVLPGEKWYVSASYAKTDAVDTPLVTYSDPKGYGARAGRYVGTYTTLELGLGRSEQGFESSLPCPPGSQGCVAIPFGAETTTDSVDLEVFHVRRFRSLTYSLQGSVSQSEADVDVRSPSTALVLPMSGGPTLRVYSVAGELFPTSRLGVRVGYSRPDYEGASSEGYDIATTWFFKPRVAVQLSWSRASFDNAPPGVADPETTAIRFIGRL